MSLTLQEYNGDYIDGSDNGDYIDGLPGVTVSASSLAKQARMKMP